MKKIFAISIAAAISVIFLIFYIIFPYKKTYKNGEIRIFCWGQYIADGSQGSLNVLKAFEKENNVRISAFNTFDSCEQMYAKLKNGNSNYDIIFSCEYMVNRLIYENLIQKIDKTKLKNYKNIMDEYKGNVWGYDKEDAYSVPYSWAHVAIIYNKKLVEKLTKKQAEKVITGWDALWNKDLKQEILMLINSRDSFSVAQKVLGHSLNTTNKLHILDAAKLLKQQKPLVQAYVMDEMFDKMESGEAAISAAYSGDILNMMNSNKDLSYVFPKEGSNIFIDTVCIPKNSKNKENALKFIDFLCREDIALENAKFLNYSTPNKKAFELLPTKTKNNKIAYPPKQIIKKCEANLMLPKETNFLMENLWTDIRN